MRKNSLMIFQLWKAIVTRFILKPSFTLNKPTSVFAYLQNNVPPARIQSRNANFCQFYFQILQILEYLMLIYHDAFSLCSVILISLYLSHLGQCYPCIMHKPEVVSSILLRSNNFSPFFLFVSFGEYFFRMNMSILACLLQVLICWVKLVNFLSIYLQIRQN